jgi:hypothetical protein
MNIGNFNLSKSVSYIEDELLIKENKFEPKFQYMKKKQTDVTNSNLDLKDSVFPSLIRFVKKIKKIFKLKLIFN